MNGIQTCTLAWQYNYAKPGRQDGASLWLFNGDGLSNLEAPVRLETLQGWHKIVGPVDFEIANGIRQSLKGFLEQSGVTVIDRGIAD